MTPNPAFHRILRRAGSSVRGKNFVNGFAISGESLEVLSFGMSAVGGSHNCKSLNLVDRRSRLSDPVFRPWIGLPIEQRLRIGPRRNTYRFLPRSLASNELHLGKPQPQPLRDEAQQRFVRLALHRWGGEADLERLAVRARDFSLFRTGLRADR
jgi:hypothetical protein